MNWSLTMIWRSAFAWFPYHKQRFVTAFKGWLFHELFKIENINILSWTWKRPCRVQTTTILGIHIIRHNIFSVLPYILINSRINVEFLEVRLLVPAPLVPFAWEVGVLLGRIELVGRPGAPANRYSIIQGQCWGSEWLSSFQGSGSSFWKPRVWVQSSDGD